ncbi:MAG: flavin reductase family protein [Methanothrix sp.]|nr:flavin reductase family protein [Methanothrix sp.]
MDKISIGRNVSPYPMPVTLVGSLVEGRPNFMAASWVTRVNATPPMLAVSLNKPRYTAKGIRETRTFSVNFPGSDLLELTDYCGLVSGRDIDKSGLFEIFYGDLKTAPMIKRCPLCIECRLTEIHVLPTNDLFIGEIMGGYADRGRFTEGRLDVQKVDPLLLTMPDNRYWRVGEYLADAWSIGRSAGVVPEGPR